MLALAFPPGFVVDIGLRRLATARVRNVAAPDGTRSDGSSTAGVDGEAGTACPPARASASELASTPRADVNLELVALKLSRGKVVAELHSGFLRRITRDAARR